MWIIPVSNTFHQCYSDCIYLDMHASIKTLYSTKGKVIFEKWFIPEFWFQLYTLCLQGVIELIDNLLDGTFDIAWNATKPRGYEAVQLLEVLDALCSLIVKSLTGHVTRMEIPLSYAKAAFDMKAIGKNQNMRHAISIQKISRYTNSS